MALEFYAYKQILSKKIKYLAQEESVLLLSSWLTVYHAA